MTFQSEALSPRRTSSQGGGWEERGQCQGTSAARLPPASEKHLGRCLGSQGSLKHVSCTPEPAVLPSNCQLCQLLGPAWKAPTPNRKSWGARSICSRTGNPLPEAVLRWAERGRPLQAPCAGPLLRTASVSLLPRGPEGGKQNTRKRKSKTTLYISGGDGVGWAAEPLGAAGSRVWGVSVSQGLQVASQPQSRPAPLKSKPRPAVRPVERGGDSVA